MGTTVSNQMKNKTRYLSKNQQFYNSNEFGKGKFYPYQIVFILFLVFFFVQSAKPDNSQF